MGAQPLNYTHYLQASFMPDTLNKTGPCRICEEPINDGSPVTAHDEAVRYDRAHYDCEFYDHLIQTQLGKPVESPCRSCQDSVNRASLFAANQIAQLAQHRPVAIRHLEHRSFMLSNKIISSPMAKALLIGMFFYTLHAATTEAFNMWHVMDASDKSQYYKNYLGAIGVVCATSMYIGYCVGKWTRSIAADRRTCQALNILLEDLRSVAPTIQS